MAAFCFTFFSLHLHITHFIFINSFTDTRHWNPYQQNHTWVLHLGIELQKDIVPKISYISFSFPLWKQVFKWTRLKGSKAAAPGITHTHTHTQLTGPLWVLPASAFPSPTKCSEGQAGVEHPKPPLQAAVFSTNFSTLVFKSLHNRTLTCLPMLASTALWQVSSALAEIDYFPEYISGLPTSSWVTHCYHSNSSAYWKPTRPSRAWKMTFWNSHLSHLVPSSFSILYHSISGHLTSLPDHHFL